MASEDVEWMLDKTKAAAAKEDSHVLTCPRCSAVRYRGEPRPCDECGWQPAQPRRIIDQQPGKLVAVEEVEREADPRRSFLAQLLHIANEREYAAGWAAYKFKEKCGRFPPWSWTHEDRPNPERPSAAVLNWVRSQMTAYRQSMAS